MEKIKRSGFNIIGFSVRTTNKDFKASKDISDLWQKFLLSNLNEKLSNIVDESVYCIYTDYESDYQGEYTCILGMSVADLETIPQDMIGRKFEDETFRHFQANGEMPKAVIDTWLRIWEEDSILHRKYTYDYEVYTSQDEPVSIYLAV